METKINFPIPIISVLEPDEVSRSSENPTDGLDNAADADDYSQLPIGQEDYRLIAEQTFAGLYVVQSNRLVYTNIRFARILGYTSPKQLIGKRFGEIVHPEDRIRVMNQDQKSNDSESSTIRMVKKCGATLRVEIRERIAKYNGISSTVGCLLEIPSTQEIEQSLKLSKQKYRTIIDDINDSITEVDLKGNIQLVNKTASLQWHVSEEELIGKNFQEFVDDQTAERVKRFYNKIYRTGISGKRLTYEITRFDKTRIIGEDQVALIRNMDNEIVGFRSVSRDITDIIRTAEKLNEHRSRLETIFGSVKDAIITVAPDLTIISANPSVKNICGKSKKDIIGKVFPQCFKDCRGSCYAILQQTLEMKKATGEYHIECNHMQNHQQVVSINSSPLFDSDGRFIGAVLVMRDITLLKDLERELDERSLFQNIVGKTKKMQDIYQLLEELTNLDTTVLVTGESGTGKELIARALHYSGCRAAKPFIPVNCSALTESLLESELFGHVKGAFTGAVKDKQGRFLAADGGTIVLDEIGDISPLIQLKLLRALQEKEIERVGENQVRKVDVRVIACTNKDLKERVKTRMFREDLYYRLKVVEIKLPPLRERIEDVPLLIDHFRRSFNAKFKKNIQTISGEVLTQFMEYSWPGNIRELEHAIERAFVLCQGKVITPKHLPSEITRFKKSTEKPAVEPVSKNRSKNAQDILDALNKTQWNKTEAARLLNISRQTLYRKMNEYNI